MLEEIFWKDVPFGLWFVWYLSISMSVYVVWFVFFLSIENYTINCFLFHMKVYLWWLYNKNKRGLQISLTLYMVWNLHSSIQAWCDKYSLEDWSHQQNALGDNKTLGERIVRTWGDGSVTCKVDSINFDYQNHSRNNSPSLMSLVPSYEMAGPASPLRSIEASENVVHRVGTPYLWDWKIHWERMEGHIWHKISKTIKEREEVAVIGDHDNKAQRNNQESSN